MTDDDHILITGATGFVGSELYTYLDRLGYHLLCGTRNPRRARRAFPDREWVQFSVDKPHTMERVLGNVSRVYYLIHQMKEGPGYKSREHSGAKSFIDIAAEREIDRVVYLGGIEPRGRASTHLRSRLHTGQILRSTSVTTIELRASIIIGPGSESWQVVRDLAARLPIMILPKWAETKTEPVFIDDVLIALKEAMGMDRTHSCVYDIPGPDKMTIEDILVQTAEAIGHRPDVVRVPFVTPGIAKRFLHFLTGADSYLAGELLEGLQSDLTARQERVLWPEIDYQQLVSFTEAVRLTMIREQRVEPVKMQLYEWMVRQLSGTIKGGLV